MKQWLGDRLSGKEHQTGVVSLPLQQAVFDIRRFTVYRNQEFFGIEVDFLYSGERDGCTKWRCEGRFDLELAKPKPQPKAAR